MWWKRLAVFSKIAGLMLLFILVVAPEWPVFAGERHQLYQLIGRQEFDYVAWELAALFSKGEAEVAGGHLYLDEVTRREIVLHYLHQVGETWQIRQQIARLFVDAAVTDPFAAAAPLEQQLDAIQSDLARLQPLAESILQEQVASILLAEGFGVLGQLIPPVQARITPLPTLLVISRRDRIEELTRVSLTPGLEIPERERLETAIFDQLDRSALIVPLGGVGTYPSMIIETTSLLYLTDVIAHEWAHNWLTLRPLGFNYNASPAMRVINETVASVFGEFIGLKVMERYYPDLIPPPRPVTPPTGPTEPPAFDFRAEMAATRIRVDELLADGRVEEAEAYMEERRQIFVANGYLIRKLNQAYFAFYGSYADQPGATGGDPTGPMVVAIFQQSSSIYQFMQVVAPVTSFAALEAVAKTVGAVSGE